MVCYDCKSHSQFNIIGRWRLILITDIIIAILFYILIIISVLGAATLLLLLLRMVVGMDYIIVLLINCGKQLRGKMGKE